ncbi:hypothetical protein AAVH_19880 [Aphelenchoides avenae]|nr:hypothetical protein AAVH_19880 [Aphelenchus avenae]
MHDVCIGIPASEFSRIDKYYCLLCISKTPSLRITYSRASLPSKSSTDALLEKLIEKLDALCNGLAKVTSRVDALEQQKISAPAVNQYGQPPPQPLDVASIVCKVMAEQQVAERKKTRAVLERVPVQSPEEDVELVQSLAEKCGVAAELIAEDIHRHGQEAEGRRRIMKVPFNSTEARDKFIHICLSPSGPHRT